MNQTLTTLTISIVAFLPCTKTVHKCVVFLQKKIFGCGIYKNLRSVGPPGPGGRGSAKRGIDL
jgi:hypothetical protein